MFDSIARIERMHSDRMLSEPHSKKPPFDLINLTGEDLVLTARGGSRTPTFRPIRRATVRKERSSNWTIEVTDWVDWPTMIGRRERCTTTLRILAPSDSWSVRLDWIASDWMTDDQQMDLDLGEKFPEPKDGVILVVNHDVAIALLHCGRLSDIMTPAEPLVLPDGTRMFGSLQSATNLL